VFNAAAQLIKSRYDPAVAHGAGCHLRKIAEFLVEKPPHNRNFHVEKSDYEEIDLPVVLGKKLTRNAQKKLPTQNGSRFTC